MLRLLGNKNQCEQGLLVGEWSELESEGEQRASEFQSKHVQFLVLVLRNSSRYFRLVIMHPCKSILIFYLSQSNMLLFYVKYVTTCPFSCHALTSIRIEPPTVTLIHNYPITLFSRYY